MNVSFKDKTHLNHIWEINTSDRDKIMISTSEKLTHSGFFIKRYKNNFAYSADSIKPKLFYLSQIGFCM